MDILVNFVLIISFSYLLLGLLSPGIVFSKDRVRVIETFVTSLILIIGSSFLLDLQIKNFSKVDAQDILIVACLFLLLSSTLLLYHYFQQGNVRSDALNKEIKQRLNAERRYHNLNEEHIKLRKLISDSGLSDDELGSEYLEITTKYQHVAPRSRVDESTFCMGDLSIIWAENDLQISFSYGGRGGRTSVREILLKEVLINNRGEVYFKGVCFDKHAMRTFKLERISGDIQYKYKNYDKYDFFEEVLCLPGEKFACQ